MNRTGSTKLLLVCVTWLVLVSIWAYIYKNKLFDGTNSAQRPPGPSPNNGTNPAPQPPGLPGPPVYVQVPDQTKRTISFPRGSDRVPVSNSILRGLYEEKLNDTLAVLRAQPSYILEIRGNASSADPFDIERANARAKNVNDDLVKLLGGASDRIRINPKTTVDKIQDPVSLVFLQHAP